MPWRSESGELGRRWSWGSVPGEQMPRTWRGHDVSEELEGSGSQTVEGGHSVQLLYVITWRNWCPERKDLFEPHNWQVTDSGLKTPILLPLQWPTYPKDLLIPNEVPGSVQDRTHSYQLPTGIHTNQARGPAPRNCSTVSSATSLSVSQCWIYQLAGFRGWDKDLPYLYFPRVHDDRKIPLPATWGCLEFHHSPFLPLSCVSVQNTLGRNNPVILVWVWPEIWKARTGKKPKD